MSADLSDADIATRLGSGRAVPRNAALATRPQMPQTPSRAWQWMHGDGH